MGFAEHKHESSFAYYDKLIVINRGCVQLKKVCVIDSSHLSQHLLTKDDNICNTDIITTLRIKWMFCGLGIGKVLMGIYWKCTNRAVPVIFRYTCSKYDTKIDIVTVACIYQCSRTFFSTRGKKQCGQQLFLHVEGLPNGLFLSFLVV